MDRVYRILTESLLSEDLFCASLPFCPSPSDLLDDYHLLRSLLAASLSHRGENHLPLPVSPFLSSSPSYLPPSFSLSLPPVPSCLSLGPSPTSGGPTRRPFGQPIPSKVCYTTRRTFENGLPPSSKLFLAPSLARLSSLARRSLRQRNRGGCDARLTALRRAVHRKIASSPSCRARSGRRKISARLMATTEAAEAHLKDGTTRGRRCVRSNEIKGQMRIFAKSFSFFPFNIKFSLQSDATVITSNDESIDRSMVAPRQSSHVPRKRVSSPKCELHGTPVYVRAPLRRA